MANFFKINVYEKIAVNYNINFWFWFFCFESSEYEIILSCNKLIFLTNAIRT
jgi:hypothetical protein